MTTPLDYNSEQGMFVKCFLPNEIVTPQDDDGFEASLF